MKGNLMEVCMQELLSFNPLLYIIAIIIFLGLLIGFIPLVLFIWRMVSGYSKKPALQLSAGIPIEGVRVPLIASKLGIKQSASITFAQNNLTPLLVIYADRITYRVFFKREKYYNQIDSVAVYPHLRPWTRLRFVFKEGTWSFIAYMANQQDLDQIMRFLESKGVRVDAGTW